MKFWYLMLVIINLVDSTDKKKQGRVLCSGGDIPLESNGQEVGSGGSDEENWKEVEFAGNKRKSSSANSMFI